MVVVVVTYLVGGMGDGAEARKEDQMRGFGVGRALGEFLGTGFWGSAFGGLWVLLGRGWVGGGLVVGWCVLVWVGVGWEIEKERERERDGVPRKRVLR